MQKTLEISKELHELHGTKIFAIPMTTDVENPYKVLAEATEGAVLSGFTVGSSPEDIEALIKEITQAIVAEEIGSDIEALPLPANDQLANVRKQLAAKIG